MPTTPTPLPASLPRDLRLVGLVLAGLLAGWLLSPKGQAWAGANAGAVTALMVVGGGLVGAVLYLLYVRWQGPGALWRVDSAKVTLPVLGAVTLTVDRRQREAGWRVFVELSTRIATQRLERESGSLKAALDSLYATFTALREELKGVPPPLARPGARQADVELFVLSVLNHGLRPCLSRWHPRLDAWRGTGLPEARWPLDAACREDLEATRLTVLGFARGLGEALKVAELDALLPPAPDAGDAPALLAEERLAALEAGLLPAEGEARLRAGWLVYVELSTRIATQPLPDGAGLLGEALDSLYATFGSLRERLAELPGPTPGAPPAETVEGLTLAVLNEDLRPFLATWHPRFAAWRAQHPDAPENEWPEEAACRKALAAAQDGARSRAAALGRLLGLARAG